ncbi:MAG: hypothetical protein RBS57_04790 [Desulforhabdus sp.]|nr:hypothetical protein [Desulforhabdus sp.]
MCDCADVRGGGASRKNAPSFIYEILHGKSRSLPGRTDAHAQKIWKGISIDEHIPTEALDELDKMEAIELRASCEGSGLDHPTFLIFRFRGEEDLQKIANFVAGMNAIEDIKCGAEKGRMGLFRIGVTTPLWYQKDPRKFERWWQQLPTKIRVVLAVLESLATELQESV